jgi:hypothetical protein
VIALTENLEEPLGQRPRHVTQPELAIGGPQQVWASGSSTSTRCRSSRSTVARPTFGFMATGASLTRRGS